MPFRVTFFFQQRVGLRTAGWTTNFWNQLSDLAAVTTAAATLAEFINAFTGRGCQLSGARIQDLSAFRAATPIAYTLDSGVIGTGGTTADYPTQKVLVRLFGPAKYQANIWIGTVQDGDVTRAGQYTPSPDSVVRFNGVRTLLLTGSEGWRIYAQDKTVPRVNVTAVTLPGVVTAPGHGLVTGDQTRISQTAGISGLNRVWLITKIDNDTFQLNVPPAGGFVGALTKPGKSQKQLRNFQTIQDVAAIRATKHDVGRPFGLFSGRRRRRKT